MSVEKGSTVKIHYTLEVEGETVDSSRGKEPLSYVQGQGQIIPGLEEELQGMEAGEKTQVSLPPEKGYGDRNPEAVQNVPKSAFQNPDELEEGMMVQGRSSSGQPFSARVASFADDEVVLDMNHPLAGKTLNFEVEVVEVS